MLMTSIYRFLVTNRHLKLSWCQIKRVIYHSSTQCKRNSSSITSRNVRSQFINYFRNDHDHLLVPSSNVVLPTDPSVLFVSAGMNQFKPIFLDQVPPGNPMNNYHRVVNTQKCIRAGGKHNDLDDVGLDGSHHTFFEMLGSWSFADYFKKEACEISWDLLTRHFGIPKNRLYVTYFAGDSKIGLGPDLECRDVWLSLGLSPERVLPFGSKDNFWDMGETGPCGPCTEIHYDHLGPRESAQFVNAGLPEMVEIWNLVFIQYNRLSDGSLRKLSRSHVDTGMGLERLTSVLQGSQSNYDTDLFQPLFRFIHQESSVRPYQGLMGSADADGIDCAYRIVADHARMFSISIADGVLPDELASGHVLRRVIRRAVLTAKTKLGAPAGILARVVDPVVDTLGEAFPELNKNVSKIKNIVNEEENKFLKLFYQTVEQFERVIQSLHNNIFPGEEMFKLHFVHGFPEEFLIELIKLRGLSPDVNTFYQLLKAEKEKDKSAQMAKFIQKENEESKFLNQESIYALQERTVPLTNDARKYDTTTSNKAKILALYRANQLVDSIKRNEHGCLILDQTNFYSEAGGQSADIGLISNDNFHFQVEDVKISNGYVQHYGRVVEGQIALSEEVMLSIDEERRSACARSHTATHLLADALTLLIPESNPRSFSSEPDKIGMNITAKKTLTKPQIEQVEKLVNKIVKDNTLVQPKTLSKKEADEISDLKTNAGEIYPDPMRVIAIENPSCRSVAACCGTHVKTTGEVGVVVITAQKALAQTVRRLRALSGEAAVNVVEQGEKLKSQFTSLKHQFESSQNVDEIIPHIDQGIRGIRSELKNTPVPYLVRLELEESTEQLKRQIKRLLKKKKAGHS